MRNEPTREELPTASQEPLPYLPVYASFLPKKVLIPVTLLMIATGGVVVAHDWLRGAFFTLEILSIYAILILTLRTSRKKKETWDFLEDQHKEFIEAAKNRYQVTLTETILYQLAQGGETLLSDCKGQLRRIMIESDPSTQRTKLVEAGKL